MKTIGGVLVALGAMLSGAGCARQADVKHEKSLHADICEIVNNAPGTVGVAFVTADDTVCVNNGVHYPMMSVFKLHQALAVADALQSEGKALDTLLHISADELDLNTWSPMLKEVGSDDFTITVKRLIEYALISSDNNASNLLFNHIVSPESTDAFVRSVARDTLFSIRHTEAEMKRNHELAYENHTSPLAAALLMCQLYADSLLNSENQAVICDALSQVTTGHDRLGAALAGSEGEYFAHKTGSGYRNQRGELVAHNDVGYFRRSDGRDYALAVFIRDFQGTDSEASAIIAAISRLVYDHMTFRTK